MFFKDVIKMGLNASIYFINSAPITTKGEKHPIKEAQVSQQFSVDVNQKMFPSCFPEDDSEM